MDVPFLDYCKFVAGKTLKATHPRDFANVILSGAYKLLGVHAGNPLELSSKVYGNIDGVEQLMVINERKSPFDFEEDDVVIVPEQSTYKSTTIITNDNEQDANTQPGTQNKQTKQHLKTKPSNSSVVANNNSDHVKINSTIGKLTF